MTEIIDSGDKAAKAKTGSKFKILLRLMQLAAIAFGVLQFMQFDDPIDGLKHGALPAVLFLVLSGVVWNIADKIRIATEPTAYYVQSTGFGTERISAYLQQNLWAPIGVLCSPIILLAAAILFGNHYLYDQGFDIFIYPEQIAKHTAVSSRSNLLTEERKPDVVAEEPKAALDTMPKASFNCAKAASDAEKLICSDSSLRTLDADMGALYSRLLKETPDQSDLRQAQRTWVSEVRDACTSVDCMTSAYKTRFAELNQPSE